MNNRISKVFQLESAKTVGNRFNRVPRYKTVTSLKCNCVSGHSRIRGGRPQRAITLNNKNNKIIITTNASRTLRYPWTILIARRKLLVIETKFKNLTEEQSPFKDGVAFTP